MKLPKKKSKYLSKWAWVALAAIVIAGTSYVLPGLLDDKPGNLATNQVVEEKSVDDETEQFAEISETPTRIVIDRIGVDASIEPVGLTSDGLMAAPDTNELVGWYNQSAKAGESNYAMLLDGHYGSDTVPAVFRELTELVPGDVIEVYGEQGSKLSYEVTESYQRYAEDVDMKKALYPYKSGAQSLTIITCEGQFDPVNITYDKRTVLYAVRVS